MKEAAPSPDVLTLPDATCELRSRQLGLVRAVLWAALVFGLPAVTSASIRAFAAGEPLRAIFYIAMISTLILILAWRRAPYSLQGYTSIAISYAVSVNELADEALSGVGLVFLLTTVGMAALFLTRRAASAVLAISIGTLAVFGWLFSTGGITVPVERLANSTRAGEWMNAGLVFLMLAGMLFVSQSYLIPTLTTALNKAQRYAARLHEALSERDELVSLQRAVFEATADGILAVDSSGRVVSHNTRFAAMWALPPEALELGEDQPLLEIAKAQLKDPDRFAAGVNALYENPEARSRDLLELADGRVFERYSQPHRLGEQIVGRVWSFRDVTARLQAQQELKDLNEELEQRVKNRTRQLELANHELGAFSYSVSHDLRAPLRAINGFGKILIEDHSPALDDSGRKAVDRIRSASCRMGELIDDLLDLSRTTRHELVPDRVDLSASAREIAAELHASNPDREVKFVIEGGVTAIGDSHLLKIALENLLGNAWKFTSDTESPKIVFETTESDGATAYSVRDNGVGFEMEYVDKVFEPFQRLHSDHEFPGTGIGLATVHRIVGRHGGTIWAESTVGKGSTFSFTLGLKLSPGKP